MQDINIIITNPGRYQWEAKYWVGDAAIYLAKDLKNSNPIPVPQ